MKTPSILVILFLLCSSFTLHAQKEWSLRTQIVGFNLLNPGLEIGIEFPVYQRTIGKKTRLFQIYTGPSIEYYHVLNNHDGISLVGELGVKTIGPKGLSLQLFGGGGYLRTVLSGETFKQQPDGSFSSTNWGGGNFGQWHFGFGISQQFKIKKEKIIAVNFRASGRQPNFPTSTIIPAASIGMSFFFK